MATENVEEIEEIGEVPEIVETQDELGNDVTDWKGIALERHEHAKKIAGIGKRWETKAKKAKETPVIPPVEEKKGFDYGQKAYLKSSGITQDEFPFVEEVMKSTGKSLDEVLETKYFQAELKEKRELKASKDAIPTGSKRTPSSGQTDVDSWVAKIEQGTAKLADIPDRELRQKVVNARMKKEQDKKQFYNS